MERTISHTTSFLERTSSIATRVKNHLIYHRLYADPPARSELAISELTNVNGGLLPLPPPPLKPAMTPSSPSSPSPSPSPSPLPATPQTRRVRFVCISDTHNASPLDGVFRVPPGDVLIHAGDFTNQGTYTEIQKTVAWLSQLPHEVKIIIAGALPPPNSTLIHLNTCIHIHITQATTTA